MGDIFFFIRVMIMTSIFILLMQIQWGSATIENHALNFLTNSAVMNPIKQTANNGVVFVRNMWGRFSRGFNSNFPEALRGENQPGSRQDNFTLKRSQEFLREKAESLRQQASNAKQKIRSRFVDETNVPGSAMDANAAFDSKLNEASSTDDDELLEE